MTQATFITSTPVCLYTVFTVAYCEKSDAIFSKPNHQVFTGESNNSVLLHKEGDIIIGRSNF